MEQSKAISAEFSQRRIGVQQFGLFVVPCQSFRYASTTILTHTVAAQWIIDEF
jgi:hypothetical protein